MRIPTIHLPERRLFGGIAIGVVVGVLAVGVVTAASPAPSGSTATGSPAAGAGVARGAGLLAGAMKPGARLGVLRQILGRNFRIDVAATNATGTRNILYVRGTIAVSAGSVTVTLPDNSTQTFTVDSSTIARDKGVTIPFANLASGDHALVFGTKNTDGTYAAKLIRRIKAPKAATAAPSAAATP